MGKSLPFCGGKDRFQIWPDEGEGRGYYWCRQCDAKGDGIQFLRDFADMNYGDARKRIGVAPVANLRAPALAKKKAVEPFEPVRPDDGTKPELDTAKWRTRALDFVTWTSEQLQKAPEQLAWLAARGIDAASARQYRLGYNPGEKGRNCIIRPRASGGCLRSSAKTARTSSSGCPAESWCHNCPVMRCSAFASAGSMLTGSSSVPSISIMWSRAAAWMFCGCHAQPLAPGRL